MLHSGNKPFRHRSIFLAFGCLVAALVISSTIVGCTGSSRRFLQTNRYAESKLTLDAPNFETSVAHASGEAKCFYILFTIPLCDDQSLATIAWQRMRQEAQMEGKSAQLVNIFEDSGLDWNFFYIFYEESYTVSASVIVYR